MTRWVTGIGEAAYSATPGDSLTAVGLGSCVAVILFDETRSAAGLAHCMLPRQRKPRAAGDKPVLTVESGLPYLLEEMHRHGSRPEALQVVLVGGAAMFEFTGPQIMDVGAQNIAMAREIIGTHRLRLRAEDLGGSRGRTVTLTLPEAEVIVRTEGEEKCLVVLGHSYHARAA
ncbi:MAG TPA: chemotaxis protein CheD [Armatimonadota bacterium]|jgi:chemotaxis protein CheD